MNNRKETSHAETDVGRKRIGAASVELTADDLTDIEGAVSKIEVHGARYPDHLQKMVGR